MEFKMEYSEIYPKVGVYTGLLPDVESLYQIMKDSEESSNGKYYLRKWDEWSIFGSYAQQKHDDNEPREFGEMYDKEKYLSDRVFEAYNIAINDYLDRHSIILPKDSQLMTSSFSKYKKDVDHLDNNLAMQYHTDYIISEREMPGNKFFLTCTTYINDDYEGGDIEFFIDGNFYNHKPKAGDILVFPSTEPYYHGVKTIKNGYKYFIRNFITYPYPGSQDWLSRQITYGPFRWIEMEKERTQKENKEAMLYILDGKNLTYDEYREKLEKNKTSN
jgi:hypothetical protein